jgi:hypothetical protein
MIDAMSGYQAAVISIALTARLARSRSKQRLKRVVRMGPAAGGKTWERDPVRLLEAAVRKAD